MLADYVMKSIDSLFAHKLNTQSNPSTQSTLNKPNNSQYQHKNKTFNQETIKQSLHTIIRKDEHQRSPYRINDQLLSQVSKSRLKSILQNHKNQRIKSVVKRNCTPKNQTSPYKRIDGEQTVLNNCRNTSETQLNMVPANKENDKIKYYRDERKSMEKYRAAEKSQIKEGKKSRIFTKAGLLSHDASKSNFRVERY